MLSADQLRFLAEQRSGHLATLDARGRPRVLPVCYAVVDGQVCTPIDEKPKRSADLARLRHIRANPAVCLTVDHYEDEDWTRLHWLQIRGSASIVHSGELHARAIAALRARYRQYDSMHLESRPVIVIHPREVVEWAML